MRPVPQAGERADHRGSNGTRRPRQFLTARWQNVVLVNYRVPPDLLRSHVPPGTELDTPDGSPDLHLLSLVAFSFEDMRVRGVPIPGARRFPEVNLRFYIRRGPHRAVRFLREYVPAPLVILGARLLYQQPYSLARITHQVSMQGDRVAAHTRLAYRGHIGEILVEARNRPDVPPFESEEHFLKEHYWGFDLKRSGETFRYRVAHPVWAVYPVEQVRMTIDPGQLLGGDWRGFAWLDALHSVVFAAGSEVAVYDPESLLAPWHTADDDPAAW